MGTVLDRTQATIDDMIAQPENYYGHFDRAGTPDVSRKIQLLDICNLVETRVANLAALRALTAPAKQVWVDGHTTEADGGEGLFTYLGTGATPGDIGAAGDDDNGWHVVNAGGLIWGRVDSINSAAHWGAFPSATAAAAAAGASKHAVLQRWLDFWANPVSFGGWSFRTASTCMPPLNAILPDGVYRTSTTLTVTQSSLLAAPYADNPTPGKLEMHGVIHVNAADSIPAIKITWPRNGGKPPMKLRCNKGLTSSKATWTTYDHPKLYDNDTTYRSFSNGMTVYRREVIKTVHGNGTTFLYRCDGTGALSSTAPTHTTGSVTNGAVSLKALGTVRSTVGKLMNEYIIDNKDWGVWIDTLAEHPDITIDVEGFMVGVMCCPMTAKTSAIGWNKINVASALRCKIGLVAAAYQGHRQVNNSTERKALTGLPIGARVNQVGSTYDYIFNGPLGDEDLDESWSQDTLSGEHFALNPNWCNENEFSLPSVAPNANSGVNTTDSAYGYVGTCFGGEVSGWTVSHNVISKLSFEFSSQGTDATESSQCVLYNATEHEIHCRNDSPNRTMVLKTCHHVNPLCESNKNVAYAARTGETVGTEAWFLDVTNGRGNVAYEAMMSQKESGSFCVDLMQDVSFSSYNRMYFKSLSGWRYTVGTPERYVGYDNNASYDSRFNPDDRSFDIGLNDAAGVMVDLRNNWTGMAVIQVDAYFSHTAGVSPAQGMRARVWCFDETEALIDVQAGVFPRCPMSRVHRASSALTRATTSGRTRIYDNSYTTEKRLFGFEPWVSKAFIGIAGYRLRGFKISVLNVENPFIWSPAHKGYDSNGYRIIASKPERGIYKAPVTLQYVDPAAPNPDAYFTRLNKAADGSEYWGCSGEYGVLSPTAGEKQWFYSGAQGSATIYEYDGTSSYTSIATNAKFCLPADWVDF